MKSKKYKTGFTLIEILVYLCLFSILFGGAVVSAYNLIDGNARSQTEIIIQNEGDFLIAKISWELSKVAPSTITNYIKLNNGNITIKENGSDQILNNTNVSVSNLNFTESTVSGTTTKVTNFSFTLTSITPNGVSISQDFSSQKYAKD